MTEPPLSDLEVARRAARAGAEVVTSWWGRAAGADLKGPVDPVTAADRESEAAILSTIRRHRPDDEILAEEGGGEPLGGGRRWIVDPLDGTVNFVHGVPHVAVSVALYDGTRPLLGVVLDVFRGEEFVAAAGGGVALDDGPAQVTACDDLGAALIATGFPYDRREHAADYARVVGTVLAQVQGVRRMGTASLDLAWVAAGRYDGFWEFGLAPWDVAAGLMLIQEAGGIATDHRGAASRPGDLVIVAGNPSIQPALLRLVAGCLPGHLPI